MTPLTFKTPERCWKSWQDNVVKHNTPRYASPNFGARFVRLIRLSDVRAVHMRGARQPGYLLAMFVHHREHS